MVNIMCGATPPPVDDPILIEPPKIFEVVCKLCLAKFSYTYPNVVKYNAASNRYYRNYKYGVKCPCCKNMVEHAFS